MGGCLSSDSGPAVPNVAINMAAEPQSDQERKIADSAAKLLEKAPEHLQQLQEYKGCEKYIRTVRFWPFILFSSPLKGPRHCQIFAGHL